MLIDEGYSIRHGARYRDRVFTLADAFADGRELVLDVALVGGTPRALFDTVSARDLVFTICG